MKTLTLIAVLGLTTLSFGWSSSGKQAGNIAYLVGDWSGTVPATLTMRYGQAG